MKIRFGRLAIFVSVFALFVFTAGAFTVGVSLAAQAQETAAKPMTLNALLVALKKGMGVLPPSEYIQTIHQRGVDFEVTANVEKQLRAAGATAAIIQAARDNFRGEHTQPAPTPPRPPSTWTDPETGLIWAGKHNGSDIDWNQAVAYCANLRLGGYSDWRMPEFDELVGIYDENLGGNWAHIKGDIKITGETWSDVTAKNAPGEAWILAFYLEIKHRKHSLSLHDVHYNRALCVHGPLAVAAEPAPPAPTPVVIQPSYYNQTWTDPATKLMWTKMDNGKDMNWTQATQYCVHLLWAGFADWRLPTYAELTAIQDSNVPQNVKGDLQLTGAEWSKSYGDAYGEVWSFYFLTGRSFSGQIGNSAKMRALCVRPSGE